MKVGDTVLIEATVTKVLPENHLDVEFSDEQGRKVELTVRMVKSNEQGNS